MRTIINIMTRNKREMMECKKENEKYENYEKMKENEMPEKGKESREEDRGQSENDQKETGKNGCKDKCNYYNDQKKNEKKYESRTGK
jgi:hypothetical protein